ncbi:putative CPBP intramembrane metalloprotease [Helianthus annuus]|nr:putative Type II CAAX prenyl endopeptidase Rce1 [Helianthus annuus]KAJ0865674.1 putative CPBP intramembrane metalloprotease [Helianthus annuus]
MASPITTGTSLFSQSSLLFTLPLKPQFYSSKNLIQSSHRATGSAYTTSSWLSNRSSRLNRLNYRHREALKRGLSSVCFYKTNNSSNGKGSELRWPILQRWDVPWEWYTVSLTSLACGLSFVLTGLIASAALPYLGVQIGELSLDEKAQILFFDQAFATAVVLATLYSITNRSEQNPDDVYRYDWRDPFSLQKGWLLWAVIGLIGALVTISLTGVAMSFLNGEPPQRETDALVRLLPLIGSSGVSTAYLVGITGVLAPVLEENVFRGFLMVALTKWVPTPISIIISAAVFSAAHLTPGEFPQLFILGAALGLSYAQTRNLLTPITIHAFWNSGVILLLTFLQIQGYDIKELLQVS